MREYHIVINPASAGGKTGDLREYIIRLIEEHIGMTYTMCLTKGPMDAAKSVSEAVSAGCSQIIVVGGDGTIHEAVNGLMSDGDGKSRTLGIISSGTGNGLALSLGLPLSLETQVRCALSGVPAAIDVAKLTCRDSFAMPFSRYFVNECQIGFGAEVVRQTNGGRKQPGILNGYGPRVFSQLFSYRASSLTVSVDGRPPIRRDILGVSIGNGAITAGGVRLTPGALPDDGMLDTLIINDQHLLYRLRSFSRIPSGRHVRLPAFEYIRGTSISIRSEKPVRVAADGELLGYLPCSIEVVPAAVRIRTILNTKENMYAAHIGQAEIAGI